MQTRIDTVCALAAFLGAPAAGAPVTPVRIERRSCESGILPDQGLHGDCPSVSEMDGHVGGVSISLCTECHGRFASMLDPLGGGADIGPVKLGDRVRVMVERPQDDEPMEIVREGGAWTLEAAVAYVRDQKATLPATTTLRIEVTIEG